MEKIKVIIKRPDEEYGHVTWISNTLKNLQNIVGGHIQVVTLSPSIVAICDDEGRLKGYPYNCKIGGISFVGEIIIAGTEGEDFADIPEWLTMKMWKIIIGSEAQIKEIKE